VISSPLQRRALSAVVVIVAVFGCTEDTRPRGDAAAPPVSCTDYPEHFSVVTTGEVFPPYAWSESFEGVGSSGQFSIEQFFCSGAYDGYDSLLVAVVAEWCGACPGHVRELDAISADLDAAGMKLVYLVTQNDGGTLASSNQANVWIESIIGAGTSGVRIGDGDNTDPGAVSRNVFTYAQTYVIRRSDMVLLADENQIGGTLPYLEMAADPSRDWPTELGVVTMSNCGDGDEEASEPNNVLVDAVPVVEGTFAGGICNRGPDFYRIGIAGSWTATLLFDASIGDLDISVISESGERVAVASPTDGGLELVFAGEQYLSIAGHGGETAPYSLVIDDWATP